MIDSARKPDTPLLRARVAPPRVRASTGLNPKLYTGRMMVVYPKGTMPAGVRNLVNKTGVNASNIASASDFRPDALHVRQVLQQCDVLRFDELDAMIVNDPRQIRGLSPASIGSTPMPKMSPERYMFFAGAPSLGSGTTGPSGDLKELLDELEKLLLQFRSAAAAPAGREASIPGAPAMRGPFADSASTTWGLQAIQAISSTFTGKGVKVAIIDSGIDLGHPDFKNRPAGLQSATFVDETVDDIDGHGTHVAGTVGGLRNGTFNYGLAPDAELFIAKVIQAADDGSGDRVAADGAALAAIRWAMKNGCQIANMSLSAPVEEGEPFPDAFEQLAQNAIASGLLLIAAAGNDSGNPPPPNAPVTRQDPPAPVGHPANCPHIIAVGALAPDLSVAVFSNGGQSNPENGNVDFAAPGVDIVSTWPTTLAIPGVRPGYNALQGTSQASPHVTGLAALLSSKLGGVGGLPLWQALSLATLKSADDLGLQKRDVGFGMPIAPQ